MTITPESERNEQRLQKIVAAAGIASRRKAEELITSGRVQVNGQTVTELGSKADPERDHVRVDGKLLKKPQQFRYFMLNKPKGVVTTVSDPEGRPTVMKFFTRAGARVFPVGRLDYQSEGLLLMTNDGELANLLTSAASHVEKTYLVKVSGKPTEGELEQLRHGVMIDRGRRGEREGRVMTQPAKISLIRDTDNPWFEVVLIEGKNREIRKMFEEVGHFVEKVRRVGFGPLVLDVEPGETRELSDEELSQLKRAARRKSAPAEQARKPARRRKAGPAALPRPARKRIKTRSSPSNN
jgi:23S rRNA pseudouridine2605 synthase